MASEWRSIETAPKDGTRVLLWIVSESPYHEDHAMPGVGHWTEWNGGGWVRWHRGTPTHWMPLPEPPKPEREDDGE